MRALLDRLLERTLPYVGQAYFARWAAALLLACAAAAVVQFPVVRESPINPSVQLAGPVVVHNGDVVTERVRLGPKRVNHAEIVWRASINPGRQYLVTFRVDNERPFGSLRLLGDLYGHDYDHADQDFQIVVPAGARGFRVERTIPSHSPPPMVSLRLFHFEPGVVTISNLSLRELSVAYRVLVPASLLLLAITFAGAAVSGLHRFRSARSLAIGVAQREMLAWTACIVIVAAVGLMTVALLGPPQIFADEYAYRANASVWHGNDPAGLRDTVFYTSPNRLYFAIYSLTEYAGNAFAAARMLNVFWLVVGLAVLFAASHRVGAGVVGAAIALAYGIGPYSTHAAYFMPESLFATLFMAVTLAAAVAVASTGSAAAVACGVLAAITVFVKPHAWVLVAAIALLFAWTALPGNRPPPRIPLARNVFVAVGAFCVVAFVSASLLPAATVDNPMLGMYSSIGTQVFGVATTPSKYPLVIELFALHLAIVTAIAGPALWYGLYAAARPSSTLELTTQEEVARRLVAVASVSLLGLVALTALFTVAVAGGSAADTADRVHLRYYTFTLPLLFIGFFASPAHREWKSGHWFILLAIWAASCVALMVALPRFHWTIVDSPDLFVGRAIPKGMLAMLLAAAVVFAVIVRTSPRMIIGTAVASYVVTASLAGSTARAIQLQWQELPEDRAGRFIAALAEESSTPVVIVADLRQGLQWPYRVASYAPSRTRFVRPAELNLEADSLPGGALVFGEPDVLRKLVTAPLARFGTLQLARWQRAPQQITTHLPTGSLAFGQSFEIDFRAAPPDGLRVNGLHAPETWGTWASAENVEVQLPFTLQGDVIVRLRARGLGANIGKPIEIRLGAQSRSVVLSDAVVETKVQFDLREPANSISIRGFHLNSPAELRLPHESRSLGIGLVALSAAAQ